MKSQQEFNFESFDLAAATKKCKTMDDLMGKNGIVKQIMKAMIEKMLQAELEQHLGYSKNAPAAPAFGNSRNGTTSKTVRSSVGDVRLDTPRDRDGDFSPQLVKKHQRDISGFDEKIISMYAKGMTTRDIQDHVLDIYGAEISPAMVSLITDKAEDRAREWQNRPLETTYAIVYFDAIYYKVRDEGKVVTKAAYNCLGIDLNGKKDLLGIWIGASEGSRFWAAIFSEIKSRGVNDILIAAVDGLVGLPDALHSVFPKTEIQLCIVHMIRTSLKYVGSKNVKPFLADFKTVYRAPSLTEAVEALNDLQIKWDKIYPLAVAPWIRHWENVSAFFKYAPELRKIMYTTNAVEGLHRQFRKVTKNRSVMPTDAALFKILYLAGMDIQKKWTVIAPNWSLIISQLHVHFGERATMS